MTETVEGIVFTKRAFALARGQSGKWWTSIASGQKVPEIDGLRHEILQNIAYFWTSSCSPANPLLVIGQPTIFLDVSEDKVEVAVTRISKLMRAGLDGGRIPPEYGPFRHGTKASAFAYNYGSGQMRIVTEAKPFNSSDFYVCGFGDPEAFSLSKYEPDYTIYNKAAQTVRAKLPSPTHSGKQEDIDLDAAYDTQGKEIGLKITWEVWYSKQANPQQREFIDMPFDGPIRLRGGAGTGKTVTLALKALKILDDAKSTDTACHILFLTHSWALAEAVDELLNDLDPGAVLRRENRIIEVWPLLTLADDNVQLGKTTRRLLGPDSRNGKIEMYRRLEKHVDDYLEADWITRKSGCSPKFAGRIEAIKNSVERKIFVWDLVNEISTVFAAAGLHPRRRSDYIRLPRRRWMMSLINDVEKNVVADIYRLYFDGLLQDGLTGPEQLVSDYLRSLSTFEWERLRKDSGFDYIFVDEMHLFDEQERFVLHQLLRNAEVRPRVAMAIDPQQSPLEIFVNLASQSNDSAEIYARANLSSPKKLELTTAFRHTRSIAKFVQSLTDQGMHLHFGDEWDTPVASPSEKSEEGLVPTCKEHSDRAAQFKHCFDKAKRIVKQGDRIKVAVICLDAERFDDYSISVPGQFNESSVVVASQDAVLEALRYKARRFVVSLPEYIGGLQFDSVLVIDVNEDDSGERGAHFERRRFLTDLYVACSRAKSSLEIHATRDRGGLSSILTSAIESGLIIKEAP